MPSTKYPADARVGRIVKMLLARDGKTHADLAAALGCDQSGISRKIAGNSHWTMDDMWSMSEFFNEDQGLFLKDPDLVFHQSGCTTGTSDQLRLDLVAA